VVTDPPLKAAFISRRGFWVIRRLLLSLCAFGATTTVLGTGASSATPLHGRIGPNQLFAASVNGQTGGAMRATIRMACFGPIRPGQTGHPMAGQTVEVFRPEVIVAHDGFTGPTANEIAVFFNAPPPSPATTPTASSSVTFHRYGVRRAIPTPIFLPCAGQGNVYCAPLPASPLGPARSAVVPVNYVGQP
jgi:hypothetical protein